MNTLNTAVGMLELTDQELVKVKGSCGAWDFFFEHLWIDLLMHPTEMGDAEIHNGPSIEFWGGEFSYSGGQTDLPMDPSVGATA